MWCLLRTSENEDDFREKTIPFLFELKKFT